MKSLLRLEAYKILRCRSMLIMFAVVVVLTLFVNTANKPQFSPKQARSYSLEKLNHDFGVNSNSLQEFQEWYEAYLKTPEWRFQAYMADGSPTGIISLFFAIYFICKNFAERTVNASLYAGKTRKALFVSRLLFYYLAGIVFFASGFLAVQFASGGWPAELSPQYIWPRIGLRLLLDIGSLGVPQMLAYIFKGYVKTFCATFGFMFLISSAVARMFGEDTFFSYLLSNCYPGTMISSLSSKLGINATVLTEGRMIQCIVVAAAYIILTSAAAWFAFRRADLK